MAWKGEGEGRGGCTPARGRARTTHGRAQKPPLPRPCARARGCVSGEATGDAATPNGRRARLLQQHAASYPVPGLLVASLLAARDDPLPSSRPGWRVAPNETVRRARDSSRGLCASSRVLAHRRRRASRYTRRASAAPPYAEPPPRRRAPPRVGCAAPDPRPARGFPRPRARSSRVSAGRSRRSPRAARAASGAALGRARRAARAAGAWPPIGGRRATWGRAGAPRRCRG